MADIVNFKRFRKAAEHDAKQTKASENAVRFARTKAEKRTELAAASKAEKHLDDHKLDNDGK